MEGLSSKSGKRPKDRSKSANRLQQGLQQGLQEGPQEGLQEVGVQEGLQHAGGKLHTHPFSPYATPDSSYISPARFWGGGYEKEGASHTPQLTQEMREHLRKDNVGLLLTLEDRTLGRRWLIGNTHILWNPKRGLVKLKQMGSLLEHAAAKLADTLPTPAFVLCGDFNCSPGSKLHDYLRPLPRPSPP